MVRVELGADIGNVLVPMVNGGVGLHKIFGLMHDTCNTANRVAALMAELRETKARAFHGDAAWDAVDPCQKIVHDFLCGNHSRNLIVDRANGFYNAFLEKELGEAMRAACVATGGRVRLECSGVCFLRSICRLTHRGHAQYVKGDGDAFGDFLDQHYPGLSNKCLSRADYSNRQDWSLEAAYEIFPLLSPLLDYEVKSLLDDANVLRDSILIQLETVHFEAYCHVCALMWRVIFMECHNNHAERPFAVLRAYKHLYPSLSRANLAKLSQSLVNGTHRPAGNGLVAGIALTAGPRLRSCIGQLCSVRRKKVFNLPYTLCVRGMLLVTVCGV
jgi:hypothetical protein